MIKVKFLKRRLYKGRFYNIGDVVVMEDAEARAYLNFRSVERLNRNKRQEKRQGKKDPVKIDNSKFENDLLKLSVKELKVICKNNKLQNYGNKNDLVLTISTKLTGEKILNEIKAIQENKDGG